MLQIANGDIIFHFNKASIADPSILKVKGESYYVKHVVSECSWSTKETPDNPHTKGAIKFRHANLIIDENNCAIITQYKENITTD